MKSSLSWADRHICRETKSSQLPSKFFMEQKLQAIKEACQQVITQTKHRAQFDSSVTQIKTRKPGMRRAFRVIAEAGELKSKSIYFFIAACTWLYVGT